MRILCSNYAPLKNFLQEFVLGLGGHCPLRYTHSSAFALVGGLAIADQLLFYLFNDNEREDVLSDFHIKKPSSLLQTANYYD